MRPSTARFASAVWSGRRDEGLRGCSRCRYASAPNAPLRTALGSYATAATQTRTAPEPKPLYAEKFGWKPGQRKAPDAAFTLLQLAAGQLSLRNPMDVAQLLVPESHTPDPLDALHGWMLLQTLRAVGAVELTPATLTQVKPRQQGHLAAKVSSARWKDSRCPNETHCRGECCGS